MIAIGNLRLGRVDSQASQPSRHFFGPITDFLLLGGMSLFLLPIAFLLPGHLSNEVSATMMVVALAINHPHFAHSYQIFYRGYGMLIVDGVQQKKFFGEPERRVLLANAYAIWALTWITINTRGVESELFGIQYYSLDLPSILHQVAIGVTALTSLVTARMLFRRWWSGKGLPVNGVMAYLITLYLWQAFVRIDPIWLLLVPALHSLQYLAIVWRHEYTRDSERSDAFEAPRSHLMKRFLHRMQGVHFFWFVVWGFVLGLLGFWLVPLFLEAALPIAAAGETSIYLFSFWIFINVHHYFIDNVIWRSENPDVKKYLFGEPRKAPASEAVLQQAA